VKKWLSQLRSPPRDTQDSSSSLPQPPRVLGDTSTQFGSPYLTTAEAAYYLRISGRQLERLRKDGGGPRFRPGRPILYHVDWLDEWASAQAVESISEFRAKRDH
jgi:excisionase family DNA binding protein